MTFFEVFLVCRKRQIYMQNIILFWSLQQKKKKDFLRNQSIKKLKNVHVF